jgi:hypothetical protein
MEYLYICHDECYLNGVVQETLNDPKLEECTAMEPYEGKTLKHLFLLHCREENEITGFFSREMRVSGRVRDVTDTPSELPSRYSTP